MSCINVHSKADISQLNLQDGTKKMNSVGMGGKGKKRVNNDNRNSTTSNIIWLQFEPDAFALHQQQLVYDGGLHCSLVCSKAEQLFHSLGL